MVCKSVKRVCIGYSGKKAVLSALICSMLFVLSGCGSGIADAYEDSYREEASARIFNGESGYYDDDTAEREVVPCIKEESYTVMIDRAGEYTFAFYAREYYGKLTIKPAE